PDRVGLARIAVQAREGLHRRRAAEAPERPRTAVIAKPFASGGSLRSALCGSDELQDQRLRLAQAQLARPPDRALEAPRPRMPLAPEPAPLRAGLPEALQDSLGARFAGARGRCGRCGRRTSALRRGWTRGRGLGGPRLGRRTRRSLRQITLLVLGLNELVEG